MDDAQASKIATTLEKILQQLTQMNLHLVEMVKAQTRQK